MTYRLVRPGISLRGADDFAPNTPAYPFHYIGPKVGDTVWVIVVNRDLPDDNEDWAIDTTSIVEVTNFYEEAVRTYEYRQKVLRGELENPTFEGQLVDFSIYKNDVPPDPSTEPDYAVEFWIDRYNPGHAVDFGETLFSSFAEAKSVFLQYYMGDHKSFHQILEATEEDLKPEAR